MRFLWGNRRRSVEQMFDRVLSECQITNMRMLKMSKALDDLAAQVKANTDLEASAAQAIKGIADQLAQAHESGDDDKIEQLVADLHASADSLAAAIPAGTPAAGAPSAATDQPQG